MYNTYTTLEALYNNGQWHLVLHFAGECLLLRQEIKIVQRRGQDAKLVFFDIRHAEFGAKALCANLDQMQSSLHASFADGRWIAILDSTRWSANCPPRFLGNCTEMGGITAAPRVS